MTGKFWMEILTHYQCGECFSWWSVDDGDPNVFLSCPFCMTTQRFNETPAPTIDDDDYSSGGE